MGILDVVTTFFTDIAKIIVSIIDICLETFQGIVNIIRLIPDTSAVLLRFFDLMPGAAKVILLMMLSITILIAVVKLIDLIVPFM